MAARGTRRVVGGLIGMIGVIRVIGVLRVIHSVLLPRGRI